MTLGILFAAHADRWADYRDPLTRALAARGIEARLSPDLAPEEVDYIVYAPNGPISDFSPYARAKAVLSLWAGVERIVGNQSLTQPLCRMVDSGLSEGMVEYVVGHTLRYHLGMDRHIVNPGHEWVFDPPPLARSRQVTILGLGELGRAVAAALVALNFRVAGWSRTPREVPGVTCHHGPEGLPEALAGAEIVVTLLPRTPETENILDAAALARLPRGARIINPGRGALIDDAALLAALDSGQVGHATLDVFRVEPLPADHPYWAHPHVTVTPHLASETRADTASEVIAENVRRGEAGEPYLFLVDRKAGY